MDIPRGHAMLPLSEPDFLDFVYNYFKAEYQPIRSFWSTATADPRQPHRWIAMGHELSPLSFRPANAQAQKDLESLDFFTRKWNLDAGFVRGIVVRFAKYEVHERLEKKLFESCRLDLMVRKALKEKHLIDALWPSPAPRNLAQELLQQGVQVRKWYGDMFAKYFQSLHAVDDFGLRPEVDLKIKSSGTLMLVPFVDHLVFGTVDPIMPIIAKGASYSNAKGWKSKEQGGPSFGEPDRFEVRFDAPGEIVDTHTRSVVRQCQCLKCGSKRDVTVVISIDPTPGPTTLSKSQRRPSNPNISAPRRQASKAAQKYSPGYNMPGFVDTNLPRHSQPTRSQSRPEHQDTPQNVRSPSPQQKKQCPRCTFLNHPDLTVCEMCQGELPETLVTKPPSPVQKAASKRSHAHTASLPPPASATAQKQGEKKTDERPAPPNRHSLSSSLFSIFPFSQQHQSEHHANLPPTQHTGAAPLPPSSNPRLKTVTNPQTESSSKHEQKPKLPARKPSTPPPAEPPSTPPPHITRDPALAPDSDPDLSHHPEMTLMPLTPPAEDSSPRRAAPAGMPQHLMDDFVPVSPQFVRDAEDEDAGWGEMSREEARKMGESDGEEEEEGKALIDLDEVAREEMGVWGTEE